MSPLSAPFQDRELNGEVLLGELAALRKALVPQKVLNALAQEVRQLPQGPHARALERIKELATRGFQGYGAIARLMEAWAPRVRTAQDVEALAAHLERLALTSALLTGLWQGARKLASERGRG